MILAGLTACDRKLGVRSPTFQYVREQEGGCGDLYCYKGTADRTEVLWVSADKKKLELPDKGSKTFDLATAPEGLVVAVDLWQTAPRFSAYCNDVSDGDAKLEATWKAKKGKITLTVFLPPNKEKQPREQSKASIRLQDVLFEDDAGNQATLKDETITEVLVGWYAG
jgi:hypothetical protein